MLNGVSPSSAGSKIEIIPLNYVSPSILLYLEDNMKEKNTFKEECGPNCKKFLINFNKATKSKAKLNYKKCGRCDIKFCTFLHLVGAITWFTSKKKNSRHSLSFDIPVCHLCMNILEKELKPKIKKSAIYLVKEKKLIHEKERL